MPVPIGGVDHYAYGRVFVEDVNGVPLVGSPVTITDLLGNAVVVRDLITKLVITPTTDESAAIDPIYAPLYGPLVYSAGGESITVQTDELGGLVLDVKAQTATIQTLATAASGQAASAVSAASAAQTAAAAAVTAAGAAYVVPTGGIPSTAMSAAVQASLLRADTGGAAGLSAYQVAVNNGFSGTEPTWLASLKGTDGLNGLRARGAWVVATAYAVNDTVLSNGSTFRVITAHTSSGTAPSLAVPGVNYEVLAAKGDTGSAGATGTNGTNGVGVVRGAWTSGTAYAVNDIVTANGSSFTVTAAHTASGTAPTTTTPGANYAVFVSAGTPGAAGTNGVGVTRGAWTLGTAYAVNDIVTAGGSSFIVTTAHTATGTAPTTTTPGANYAVFVAAGTPGTAGTNGVGIVRGAWVTATAYAVNDIVSSGGSTFRVITAHTSAGAAPTVATPGANYEVFVSNVNPVQVITLASNAVGANTSTAIQDTGFTFPVVAGTYYVSGFVNYTSSPTADIRFAPAAPAGSVFAGWMLGGDNASTATIGYNSTLSRPTTDDTTPRIFRAVGTGTSMTMTLEWVITVTTAGNIKLRFAQALSTTETDTTLLPTVLAGSTLFCSKIA